MLQLNSVANVGVHRTCTPLYEKYEATPLATFLDPNETENIYSGMVMYRTGPDTVALLDGASSTALPFGLSAHDRNPNIDDWTQTNNNSWTVWLGGANALFQISAPAFDTTQTYTVPTNGSRQYLYCGTGGAKGMITSATTTAGVVAELINVLSPTTIVVRFIPPGVTAGI